MRFTKCMRLAHRPSLNADVSAVLLVAAALTDSFGAVRMTGQGRRRSDPFAIRMPISRH